MNGFQPLRWVRFEKQSVKRLLAPSLQFRADSISRHFGERFSSVPDREVSLASPYRSCETRQFGINDVIAIVKTSSSGCCNRGVKQPLHGFGFSVMRTALVAIGLKQRDD